MFCLSGLCALCVFAVHKEMGPGLLENVYEECLCFELHSRGLVFSRQVDIPLKYLGELLTSPLRVDLLVGKLVVVEVKAVEKMQPLYEAQLLTYLKLTSLRLGYLINFNVPLIRDGIKRMIL